MSDSGLFTSGSLFSTDYLVEAIKATAAYQSIDAEALRDRLGQIAAVFPQSPKTNESQTEDDFIWPVLAALGWSDSLRQHNLSASGRDDVLAAANVFRAGQGADLTDGDHRDPARQPIPRYWVKAANCGWDAPTDWCLALKDVTSVTNARTTITAVIPRFGAGHTLPVMFPANGDGGTSYAEVAPLVLANLNSVILDYLARQKVHGNHLAWYLLEQLPIVPPATYARMFGPKTAAEIVREAVLELTYTAHDLAPFARDMGYVDDAGEVQPPFTWDEERRFSLRTKLDAVYFILYGVFNPARVAKSRDDIRYIYSTFPIVERQDGEAYGHYRSCDLTLAWINALIAGEPDADVTG